MEIKLCSRTMQRIFLTYQLKFCCLLPWSLSFALRTSSAEEAQKIAKMGQHGGGWEDERRKKTRREEKEMEQKPEKNVPFIPEKKYWSKKAHVAFPISIDASTPTHKVENVPKFQSQSSENKMKRIERAISRKLNDPFLRNCEYREDNRYYCCVANEL